MGDHLKKKLLTTVKREYRSLQLKLQRETSELFAKALLSLWGEDSQDYDFRSLVEKVCAWISLEKPRLLQRREREEAVRRLEDYAKSLLPSDRSTCAGQSNPLQGKQSAAVNLWSTPEMSSVSPHDHLLGGDKLTNTVSTSSLSFETEVKQTVTTREGSKVNKGFHGRVEGIIKRFREKNIIVALSNDCAADEEIEILIPRKALFSGGVRLNPGDTLTFKRSEKDPHTGYAPELVRLVIYIRSFG